jgi:ABC-type transporter Mla maintaining outer membrane lipid asymmetry ATPase subunit MlaF
MTTLPLRFADVILPKSGTRVSLEVPEHRTVSVQGAEESGVDALPSYALALTRPSAGQVFLFGEEIAMLPERAALAFRRRVGYLPAGDGLLQNLTLSSNVALPLRFGSDLSEREIRGRLQIMLAMVRIADAASLRPADATDEQRRRTALARALAFDPQLLILADPFDGLTVRAAAELLEIARGGESGAGARRAVFVTGQSVPARIEPRVDLRYRLANGELTIDT